MTQVFIDDLVRMEENEARLTPEQIENWRNTLFNILGGYALIMPAGQIQNYRDAIQFEIKRQAALAPKKKYKR